MLKEQFLGRNPSHFIKTDPVVKAYIISESLLWSGWNFVTPIFAVFVTQEIEGGTVAIAASSISVYLISRVIFELISGKYAAKSRDRKKIYLTIAGIASISIAYIGFATVNSLAGLFIFNAIAGMGLGISSPAKNALFSIHLDKNKEAAEWGVSDASVFICMALATTLGGLIAITYGFSVLFLLAFVINLLSIIPYFLYLKRRKTATS